MPATEEEAVDKSPRKVGRGKQDGTGPFAGTQHGGGNDGVSSAKPQVVTGQEDASFDTDPEGRKGRNLSDDR